MRLLADGQIMEIEAKIGHFIDRSLRAWLLHPEP
jgi:hypothetical protein